MERSRGFRTSDPLLSQTSCMSTINDYNLLFSSCTKLLEDANCLLVSVFHGFFNRHLTVDNVGDHIGIDIAHVHSTHLRIDGARPA